MIRTDVPARLVTNGKRSAICAVAAATGMPALMRMIEPGAIRCGPFLCASLKTPALDGLLKAQLTASDKIVCIDGTLFPAFCDQSLRIAHAMFMGIP
jgi:hypothetical protein